MTTETFIEKTFRPGSVEMIDQANHIIGEYQGQGYTLTLRQLYYQFVARALLENKQGEYKRLGSVLSDARLAGLVDWSAIEDRTRNLKGRSSWSSPDSIIRAVASSYHKGRWVNQPWHVEVWIEKEALIGVIERACYDLDVDYFACRGYSSQSEQYLAGDRFANAFNQGKSVKVLHLGDHDPSGMDMTRDNADRLSIFARQGVEVERIALNMDQVEEFSPPPNPAKLTDSRATDYIAEYGSSSWELDALEPSMIDQLIRDHVEPLIDQGLLASTVADEEIDASTLRKVHANWAEVAQYVNENF